MNVRNKIRLSEDVLSQSMSQVPILPWTLQKLTTERRSRVSEQFLEDVCVHGMEGIFSDGRRAYDSASILWLTIKPFEANSPRRLKHEQNVPGDAGESIWIGIS